MSCCCYWWWFFFLFWVSIFVILKFSCVSVNCSHYSFWCLNCLRFGQWGVPECYDVTDCISLWKLIFWHDMMWASWFIPFHVLESACSHGDLFFKSGKGIYRPNLDMTYAHWYWGIIASWLFQWKEVNNIGTYVCVHVCLNEKIILIFTFQILANFQFQNIF